MGVSVQVYHISSEYFAYGITTRVELIIKDNLEIPTMSFCILASYLFKWENMSKEERISILHDNNIINRTVYDAINKNEESLANINYTLESITSADAWDHMLDGLILNIARFFNVTFDLKTMFAIYDIYTEHSGTEKNLTDSKRKYYFDMRQTLDGRFKCVSIERKDKFRVVNYYHVMRKHRLPGMIDFMEFDINLGHRLENVIVMLTSSKKPLTKDISRRILNFTSSFTVTWQSFYNKLLPKPFETKCVNYTKRTFLSQGHCFEQCLKQSFHNESNGQYMPPGVQVSMDASDNILKKRFLNFDELKSGKAHTNETWGKTLKNKEITCERDCEAKDCESTNYNPVILEKFGWDPPGFGLSIPYTPTISSTCLEAVSLIQFLTDLVSALGFWLGVSAFGLFDQTKKFVTSVTNNTLGDPNKVISMPRQRNRTAKRLQNIRHSLE